MSLRWFGRIHLNNLTTNEGENYQLLEYYVNISKTIIYKIKKKGKVTFNFPKKA